MEVKVVGKIELVGVDVKKQRFESIRKASVHFRERLKERYGIEISFYQYLAISKKGMDRKDGKFIITIRNIPVRVVQRGRILITALPLLDK